MTVIQHSKLLELLQHVQGKQGQTLVSHVQKTIAMDPLTIIANAERLQYSYFFWKHPSQPTWFVGVGELYAIEATGTDRFKYTSKTWKRLLDNAIVDNPYVDIEAVGPVLFGGYSFDETEKISKRWKDFQAGTFVVPKLMYTYHNGEGYVTYNLLENETTFESPYDTIETIDWLYNEVIQTQVFPIKQQATLLKRSDGDVNKWKDTVKQATDDIKDKKLKKVVLARDITLQYVKPVQVVDVLDTLLLEQETSYIFAIKRHDSCFIGATPERLIQKKQNQLFTTCLAGTAPRGNTTTIDQKLEAILLQDDKNKGEHQLVVDMISEAMSQVCTTTDVPKNPTILKTKHVQHLYTPISGMVNHFVSIMDVVELLHPTPALGGYPRKESLQFIKRHEQLDRGWYASPIGWVDYEGDGEFAVAIRSGLIQGNKVYVYAGCGIVADSEPDTELEETKMKLRPMLSALGGNCVE